MRRVWISQGVLVLAFAAKVENPSFEKSQKKRPALSIEKMPPLRGGPGLVESPPIVCAAAARHVCFRHAGLPNL